MAEDLSVISEVMKALGRVTYTITHPIIIWNWLMGVSYWLAVIICVMCILIYGIAKIRKASQIMWVTIIIYLVLKGVDMVI